MRFFSSIGKNLIDLALKEAEAIGLEDVRTERGSLSFEGGFEDAVRYCLLSRVSVRVMLLLAETDGDLDADSLKRWIADYPFENHFGPENSISVTNSIVKCSNIRNTMLCSQVVKDGICDRQRGIFGIRSNVDKDDADFVIHLFMTRDRTVLYLDFSGQSLSKRRYRVVKTPVYLQEHSSYAVFQRGLVKDKTIPIVDPFVGSGTILIEAALFYADAAPGLVDPERFAFLKYREFDRERYDRLLASLDQRRKEGLSRFREMTGGKPFFFGFDQDEEMIEAARANAEKAGVLEFIRFERKRIQELAPEDLPDGEFVVITDPPYSIRERVEDAKGLYADLNSFLERNCKGRHASVLAPESENFSLLNLKPWKSNSIMNGQLKCSLNCYYVLTDEEREQLEEKKKAEIERRLTGPLSPGAALLYERLIRNKKKLSGFLNKNSISCYRLYDADLRQFPMSLDIYERWAVAREYWNDDDDGGGEEAAQRLDDMICAISRALGIMPSDIYVKTRKRMRGREQYERTGPKDGGECLIVRENGLRFLVNFTDHFDTYLFLDHRAARAYIRERCKGKRFLNLFCYTGTASANAKKGGAISTISVDANGNYLDIARRNFRINGFGDMSDFFIKEDALTFLKSLRRNDIYDFIFLDPPTFSNGKNKRDFDLRKRHEDLIRLCMMHLDKDGELLFTCNFRSFRMSDRVIRQFDVRDITQSTLDEDFAGSDAHMAFSIRHRPERRVRSVGEIADEIAGKRR